MSQKAFQPITIVINKAKNSRSEWKERCRTNVQRKFKNGKAAFGVCMLLGMLRNTFVSKDAESLFIRSKKKDINTLEKVQQRAGKGASILETWKLGERERDAIW